MQSRQKNTTYSIKKSKHSQDLKNLIKINKLNLDSNSNNSTNSLNFNGSSLSSKESNSNLSYKIPVYEVKKLPENTKKESDAKTPVNPFVNAGSVRNSKTNNEKEISPVGITNSKVVENSIESINLLVSSPAITTTHSSKDSVRGPGPIIANLSSNFFNCKSSLTSNNNQNNVTSSLYMGDLTITNRRFSNYFNTNLKLDSLINFEYIKCFTNLEAKDILKEEMIYSAEICNVYKGKYLGLPVAIKIYNIAKLKEEDLVRFKIFKINNF
jgi:hypothetical protein